MRAQTFVGKVSVDSLRVMDEHMNNWLQRNNVEPKQITQTFGFENHHAEGEQPVLITTVWF
jgi:hypothetical protein